jgi:protein O-mannosyl-transferase
LAAVTSKARKAKTGRSQLSSGRPRLTALVSSQPWIPALFLALTTIAVYFPAHRHPFFTMDDRQYVIENVRLQAPFGEMFSWAFTSYDLANWHPVTWLSHAADVHLFGLDPAGHHDVNVLLHALNAALLFWVLCRATGYPGRSFMVAALFALHPVNVETVAWVAERKNLLSMMFFLLALGAYRLYVLRPRVARYLVVAALFALGLMAKPQIITFPFVLLLWDYWPLGRIAFRPSPFALRQNGSSEISGEKRTASSEWRFPRLLLEKLPLLALSAASAFMTMNAQLAAGAMRYYPLSARLGNAAVCYVRYLRNALWPSRLAVFYPHPALSAWNVAGSLLVLLGITGFVLYAQRQRYLAVGWFWFLGTLVPMIGLVQVGEQAMADRYAYLSFIGLFLMVCWGIAEFSEQRGLAARWLAIPSIAALLLLAVLTHRQLDYWGDNVKLWSHMMTVTGGTYEVEENLGVALLENGQTDAAMQHFQRVTALVPRPPAPIGRELAGFAAVAHLYLGAYEQRQQRPANAIPHFRKVLQLADQFAVQNRYGNVPPLLIRMQAIALADMGDAYYVLGDFTQSKKSYEGALALGPLTAHQWMGLGIANQRSGNLAAAIEAYKRSTRLQVSDVGFLLLAQALDKAGQANEAEAARAQARLVSPDMAAAQRIVDQVLRQ